MALDTSNSSAVKQAAQHIINQRQFTSQKDSTWDRVLYYASHPLDLLTLALRWVSSRFASGHGAASIAAAVVSTVLFIVIVFLAVRFLKVSRFNKSVRVFYAPGAGNISAEELLRRAEEAEAQANWRESIRWRYSALVVQFGERGLVKVRDGRTTGEYLREAQQNAPSVGESFGRATRLFEGIWYGDVEATNALSTEFQTLARSANQMAAA